ncbi:MAG: DUF488 domain-containing protein [Sedimentisphaerales bacterium]|nr:DUF488 domain-containing protein [Sedimentisphaerales bacterium]
MKSKNNKISPYIYTIGHSNIDLELFLCILNQYHIAHVVDIRQFPSSRRFPYFNSRPLQQALSEQGIHYTWMQDLGGRRPKVCDDSPNKGLRVAGFRNYADYTATKPFRTSADRLIWIAEQETTAYMCAEKMFFQCHRRILSDFLAAQGLHIMHIIDADHAMEHTFTDGLQINSDKSILYPGPEDSPPEQPLLFDL